MGSFNVLIKIWIFLDKNLLCKFSFCDGEKWRDKGNGQSKNFFFVLFWPFLTKILNHLGKKPQSFLFFSHEIPPFKGAVNLCGTEGVFVYLLIFWTEGVFFVFILLKRFFSFPKQLLAWLSFLFVSFSIWEKMIQCRIFQSFVWFIRFDLS